MKKLYTPQFRLHLKSLIKRQYATKKSFRIGIRREDKNCWERRVPLVPRHVKKLVDSGIEVYIEPSTIRCFTDEEYEKAGAIITDDLSPANTILCVKEVPPRLLLNDKTYMYFSHTIKAQPQNMPALDAIMQKVKKY
jgi:alpha-aminoadipic semialdehyde synthase